MTQPGQEPAAYERRVGVLCSDEDHLGAADRSALGPITKVIQDPKAVGIDAEELSSTAALDDAIAEFSRFYLERREQEIRSAGDDERKRQKLRDEIHSQAGDDTRRAARKAGPRDQGSGSLRIRC